MVNKWWNQIRRMKKDMELVYRHGDFWTESTPFVNQGCDVWLGHCPLCLKLPCFSILKISSNTCGAVVLMLLFSSIRKHCFKIIYLEALKKSFVIICLYLKLSSFMNGNCSSICRPHSFTYECILLFEIVYPKLIKTYLQKFLSFVIYKNLWNMEIRYLNWN